MVEENSMVVRTSDVHFTGRASANSGVAEGTNVTLSTGGFFIATVDSTLLNLVTAREQGAHWENIGGTNSTQTNDGIAGGTGTDTTNRIRIGSFAESQQAFIRLQTATSEERRSKRTARVLLTIISRSPSS